MTMMLLDSIIPIMTNVDSEISRKTDQTVRSIFVNCFMSCNNVQNSLTVFKLFHFEILKILHVQQTVHNYDRIEASSCKMIYIRRKHTSKQIIQLYQPWRVVLHLLMTFKMDYSFRTIPF